MIRFIDIREQGTGDRFAFWDTVTDSWVCVDGDYAWSLWEDFAKAAEGILDLSRYRSLCPDWVDVEDSLDEERVVHFKITDGPDIFETNAPCPWCGCTAVYFGSYLYDAWIQCGNEDCEAQGPSVTYSRHAEESARLEAMKKWAKTDDIKVS